MGCRPIIPNSSELSAEMRNDILTYSTYPMQEASATAVNAAGLRPLARSIVETVAHELETFVLRSQSLLRTHRRLGIITAPREQDQRKQWKGYIYLFR